MKNSQQAICPSTMPSQRIVGAEARHTPRRGLSRAEAALYVGISPTKFDSLIKDGRMCAPKRIDGRVVWDIRQLDTAFDELPSDREDDRNPWDNQ